MLTVWRDLDQAHVKEGLALALVQVLERVSGAFYAVVLPDEAEGGASIRQRRGERAEETCAGPVPETIRKGARALVPCRTEPDSSGEREASQGLITG